METKQKRNQLMAFRIVSIISIIIAALFMVLMLVVMGLSIAGSGVVPGVGDILRYIYQNNGFLVALFLVLLICFYAAKNKRDVLSKFFFWGMLLLGMLYAAGFFNTLYYIPQMGFLSTMELCGLYAPSVCAAVSLVALLVQWESADKKITNWVSSVCSVIAACLLVFYLTRMVYIEEGFTTVDYLQVFSGIFGLVSVVLVSVNIAVVTSTRRTFDRVVYAMTDEEAMLVENVEDKVETVVEEFEEEMLDEIARRMEEDEEEMRAVEVEVQEEIVELKTEEVESVIGEIEEELQQDEEAPAESVPEEDKNA